jgi:hypothetical protein
LLGRQGLRLSANCLFSMATELVYGLPKSSQVEEDVASQALISSLVPHEFSHEPCRKSLKLAGGLSETQVKALQHPRMVRRDGLRVRPVVHTWFRSNNGLGLGLGLGITPQSSRVGLYPGARVQWYRGWEYYLQGFLKDTTSEAGRIIGLALGYSINNECNVSFLTSFLYLL